ncbi:hypothetical protein ACLKA7_000287 [Drosophila subpalustris]
MKAKLKYKYDQLLAATLCTLLTLTLALAAAEAQPVSSYGASFISNPAIYAYNVANQQQQQQQQQQLINFDTANANLNRAGSGVGVGASNRNYYYTDMDANGDAATPTLSTPPAAVAASVPASSAATQPAPLSGCTLDRLAVYKVVLHTYWTRELFPKHYPDWRPTAQWTKTLGRTHNANYALYHIGQPATAGVKQFAETGKTELLDSNAGEQQQQQMQAGQKPQDRTGFAGAATAGTTERTVFDEFSMPAIQLGAGRSEAKVFVDSNHSLVSLMTRIVPSPDWFIGVDSFELCVGGSWIDTVTVELDPLDAGTDNGFTFTAPNWPTAPQGVIYRITSRYPGHPAGSFYYPKSKRLPPIATFQFIKLKEYELSEVFNIAEDDRKYEMVQTQTHLDAEHNHVEMNNELSASIERERQREREREREGETPQQLQLQQYDDERQRIRSQLLAKMNPINRNNMFALPATISLIAVSTACNMPRQQYQQLSQQQQPQQPQQQPQPRNNNSTNTDMSVPPATLVIIGAAANRSQKQKQQRQSKSKVEKKVGQQTQEPQAEGKAKSKSCQIS